jgi:serine phosphatase RsbU (regulator of sigma subunit)
MSESVVDFRIRSMMCAPLVDSDGKAMGILQIDTPNQHQRFQDEDLELLVSVAYQASIAIDNARLHEEALERRTLERDLKLARDVQHAFLPDGPPDLEGYEFFDYYRAANHIGGDYYDYIRLPDGRLAVVVADVVGHGVAAAMLMAKLFAETRSCLASEPLPAKAVTNLNARLCRLNLHRFVTFVMVALDTKSHEVTIVNAGHMPPLYRREDGGLEEPSRVESGIPLGVVDGTQYQPSTVTLRPGESLTMYTDGIDEARNSQGKQFSIARMRELVQASDGSPRVIGESILDQVARHLAGLQQDDDMCLVSFRRQ